MLSTFDRTTTVFLNTASLTIPNNITISGTGYSEAAGTLGAIRSSNLDIFTGTITVNGSAKIGALGGTAIVSGTLTGGTLTFGGSINNAGGETLAITGNASGLAGIIVNDGTATSSATSIAVNVGNNTASGTIGAVPVSLLADGFKNSVIRFDRTDGYTLGAAVTSTSAAANHLRTFIDADSQGTGFSDGGFAITLGGATAATGGSFRVGLNRANSIANISGALTAGTFLVGANALTPIANINTGANVNLGTARIATGTSINSNSTLNFNGGTFTAFSLGLGEVNSGNGIVNQTTGSTVSIDTQLRVGHFATNTSVYNMNGGALTMTGASPTLTPSTAGAGAASATGDNNINALVTPALVGGGIYLGIDGQGVFNHTGGTVTTNWIVLDNRGASGAGTNMIDGLDRYNLSGSSILNLRSNWGLLGRNEGSYVVSLGGGIIRVDNTGTGTGTGANITILLDATMSTVASTTTTLDTNGAGNAFTLTKNTTGIGTLALTGGGIVNLSTTGNQVINARLSGSTGIAKLGAGITDLNGVSTGYVGPISVNVGRLNVNTALGAASTISVAGGATLSGEPSVTSLTLGSGTGSTLLFNPNTIGAITATTLNTPLNNVLDFSAAIPGDGTYTAISYGTKVGAGVFTVAGAANYRSVTVNDTGSAIDVVLANTKALVWLGAGGLIWDINTTSNWDAAGAPGTPEKFFQADVVTFDDLSVGATAVAVTPGVSPALTQISGTTNNYTLTSTGAGIAGGEVSKDGSTTLTLAGANTYPGKTTVSGGTVSIAVPTSLGSGATGNSIVLSNGGRLLATAGLDLGVARSLAVGTGGGVLSVTNAAAQTVTVPGNLSGAGPLTFNVATGAAGAASVFLLTGTDNTAYTGAITVNATSTALATLRLTTQGAVPSASAINLAYPAAAVTTGNATTLDLAGSVTLLLGTTLNMTANLNGAISQRSQVIGNGLSFINGPITLSGNAASVIQFAPTGGTLTINGNITEASPSSFGGGAAATLFFRAAGNTVVNGTINLPTALVSRVDDTGTLTINSTGNVWATTDVRSNSTLRLGINNALPIAATMTIGQATDAGSSVFELNGFNQEIAGLNYVNGNGANTRRVTNSSGTASTLTINNTANFTYGSIAANGAGNLTGNLSIVKNGAGSQTFAGPANTYTGNVTVNGGTLVAGGGAASNALGNPTLAGRTVAVNNAGSTLSFTTNNVFGNGVGNNNLPAVTLGAGTILTSTRYNAIGGLSLNGATFTQATTDAGAYEGFQFRGNVTVGGSAQSTIATTNAKANHLNANTTFTVADATTGVDLLVSAPLRNQSGDFASAAGGLTKAGSGTMELTATNTYTGATLINDGVLRVSGSISGSAVTVDGINAILGGSGTVGATTLINGGSINPGASPGILTVAGAFTMSSGTSLNIEVNGLAVGTDYDQVSVAGVVTLAGSTLNLSGSYLTTPAITNDLFTIILNDGAGDAVVGTFAGINEGGHVFSGLGQDYTVSYVGGDGNDVVLTAVPEPGAITMLLGGVGMLLGLQRRRRKA